MNTSTYQQLALQFARLKDLSILDDIRLQMSSRGITGFEFGKGSGLGEPSGTQRERSTLFLISRVPSASPPAFLRCENEGGKARWTSTWGRTTNEVDLSHPPSNPFGRRFWLCKVGT